MGRGDRLDEAKDESYGPQAAGIPGVVRVIYVPQSEAVEVRYLVAQAAYAATGFDPVSGDKTPLGTIHADAAGRWTCAPPAGKDHDWVLILEEAEGTGQRAEVRGPRADGSRQNREDRELTLANEQIAWHLDWSTGSLRSTYFENKLSGHRFSLSGVQEVALNFSAAVDQVAQPFTRLADWEVRAVQRISPLHAVVDLRSPTLAVGVTLHYELDGPTRRKWAVVTNHTGKELLLLDVELDDLTTDGTASGGGAGAAGLSGRRGLRGHRAPGGREQGREGADSARALSRTAAGTRGGLFAAMWRW